MPWLRAYMIDRMYSDAEISLSHNNFVIWGGRDKGNLQANLKC